MGEEQSVWKWRHGGGIDGVEVEVWGGADGVEVEVWGRGRWCGSGSMVEG